MPRSQKETNVQVCGQVETVFYSCPSFSAGKLRTVGGDVVPFAGEFYAQENERLILHGKWVKHRKYGRQFQVDSMEYDQQLGIDGLASYIANHPEIKGIGPAKARIIAEQFGSDFARGLCEEAEVIAASANVPLETVEKLREVWLRTSAINGALTTLSGLGLTHLQITSLVERLGNSVVGLLRADPYQIVRLIPGFGFKRVDRIARDKMNTPKSMPERITAGVIHCVDEALDQGDCWIEYDDLLARANLLLALDELDSLERIEQAIDGLITIGCLSCLSMGERMLVAKPEIKAMEEELAQVIKRGQSSHPSFAFAAQSEKIPDMIEHSAPLLNDGQRLAVSLSLQHAISLISGGAGSGKTFTISALVGICQDYGLSVTLAAPTGKAAKRMEEMVGVEAATIHRLLGYDGRVFSRGPENLIDCDVLIVDEVSMVDVPLAWHLFRAVDLSRTAIVLVGDHNQLPPVGPGNLLRDLVKSRAVPTVILESVVRQAGVLKENSIAILAGEVRKTAEETDDGPRPWYLVDRFTDALKAQDFILELFDKVLSERLHFDIIKDVQVLTPTHKGPLGTQELNARLQQLVQKKLWGVDVVPPPTGRRPRLLPNDKIIQTKNNYDTGIMNGAVGVVSAVDLEGNVTVDFDGTVVRLEKGSPEMANIQLAYALTIHKAQGSEFPCSIVVVHKSHSFMHHRNLLYTAVTRASKSAIIVGDRWAIGNCAKLRQVSERKTFLSLLLPQNVRK